MSNITEDFALLISIFLRSNNFEIFLSCKIAFFEKLAFPFSFKFKIDKSHLPFELKTTNSEICLPSSLIISILSSAEISITERPPP